jgi:ABC-2 type transport system ATP-binding protein
MLRIEKLTKTYKGSAAKALDDVSFTIGKGEFIALLGSNGAGKTTLLNIITGVVAPESGSIILDGEDVLSGKKHLKSKFGIVPQELVFEYLFTVEETLKLYAGFYGVTHANGYIEYLLDRLSLRDKRKEIVRSLSGGMKRRLLIARALVHKPEILLLDEPTAGVDIALRRDMYAFLHELNEQGITIILTTHYLEEAENLCSRILMLKNGRLIADANTDAFLKNAGDNLKIEVVFHSRDDLEKFGQTDALFENGHTPLERSFSITKDELPGIFQQLSSIENGVKDIRINPPKLEDVFIQLSRQ